MRSPLPLTHSTLRFRFRCRPCRSTLTEDAAARAFLVGFMIKVSELQEQSSMQSMLWPWGSSSSSHERLETVMACFAAGCASFSRDGYRFGDPAEYLHPPGHAHWRRPDFQGCKHCVPPVQGSVVLLHARHGAGSGAGSESGGVSSNGANEAGSDGSYHPVIIDEIHGRDAMRAVDRKVISAAVWRGLRLATGVRRFGLELAPRDDDDDEPREQ